MAKRRANRSKTKLGIVVGQMLAQLRSQVSAMRRKMETKDESAKEESLVMKFTCISAINIIRHISFSRLIMSANC